MATLATAVSGVPAADKALARLERREKFVLFAFLVPALVTLLFFYIYPLFSFLAQSLFDPDFTLVNYKEAVTRNIYAKVLWRTLKISTYTTLGCLLIGYPVAFVMAHSTGMVRIVTVTLVLVPFWTSVLARMYAWYVLLGRQGVFNQALQGSGITNEPVPMLFNQFSVLVGMIHYMAPYMILPMFAVMVGMPKSLVDAAATLGANRLRAFWHVYLPLSLPGVGAGCLLTFIISIGFFITPALLGGPKDVLLAQLIELEINEHLDWAFAATLSALLLVVTIGLYLVYDRLLSVERIYEGR